MTSPAQRTTDDRIAVAVLYGGASPEHNVSCVSAGAIMAHLDPEVYRVVPVGITRGGTWTPGTADPEALSKHGRELPHVPDVGDGGAELQLSADPSRKGELRYVAGPAAGEVHDIVDVVFPVLHGPNGEDGTIQGLLELSRIPFVGPGVLASAAGMDKERTKNLAVAGGIPVGEQAVLAEGEELADSDRGRLGLPVFVKPARGGSSIGISKVDSWEEFPAALELARAHDSKVIVEKGIVGAEVECGVLQRPDGELVASAPAQLAGTEDSDEGFYGFDTKYLDDIISYEIPAPLPEAQVAEVRRLAVETFTALDCSGLARVDFFVTEDGPVLNEPNTMPGFTPISMYPKMFEATGVAYPELLDILIAQALR